MSHGSTYKTAEITGTSSEGIEIAIRNAIEAISQKSKKISWFKVSEIRGKLNENSVIDWQVAVRISFVIDKRE
ncbi:MAG: dodecin family protein [Fibrobacter sp.]|nr:dodecin family protein [Fibrobacter sp.]